MSITIKKATEILEVSRQTVYNYINKFTDEEREKFIEMKGNIQTLTEVGVDYLKIHRSMSNSSDTERLEKKDVYISELEQKLSEADYELQNVYKEHVKQLSEISKQHLEQVSTLTTLLSNQQALTLQAQNNQKQPLLARIFNKEKRDHTK